MLAFAYAPRSARPPELYARYTWVKELGLTWPDVGGISADEINLLVRLVNIWNEAQALKARVQSARRKT